MEQLEVIRVSGIATGVGFSTKKQNGTYSTLICDTLYDIGKDSKDAAESEKWANAIVTAVNNTYHKGINPEAVPEMLEFLAAIARHPKNDTLADFLIDDAKKLIQKSTL